MTSAREPEHENDPDWAPQLPSIWDETEEDVEDAFGYAGTDASAGAENNPFAPLLPIAERAVDWHRADAWLAAERALGRQLLDAAVVIARLDERLLRMTPARRAGLRERIALSEASDILWAEGARLRPEHLALADRDRIGRSGDAAQATSRAAWAVRRLTRETEAPVTPQAVRAFLGLHGAGGPRESFGEVLGITETEETDREGAADWDLETLWLTGLDKDALGDWCGVQTALAEAHPLTRAAAGFHLWRGFALGAPERVCEPIVLAARIAGETGQGGLVAIPTGVACPPARGGDAAARLRHWCARVRDAARRTQRRIDDLDAWGGRAHAATTDLNGKTPAALIALFEARPVLSAKDCATALGRTPAQARQILRVFAERGLIAEITGQSRFRFWKASL